MSLTRRAVLSASVIACGACGLGIRRGGPGAASPSDAELAADLAQVLWIGIPAPSLGTGTRAALARGSIGGVVLFRRNLVADPGLAGPALVALCDDLHETSAAAGPAVLVAVDQEGGRVQTIRAPATRWPAMARLGDLAASDPGAALGLAAALGRALGDELAALGVDVDFAPVLDVRLEAQNQVIGDRALAGDAATVARLGAALARGLAASGILPCGKHFPGHGGAAADSHTHLPVDPRARAALLADEVAPFAALAPTLPLLMGAHVAYTGLGSDLPGTLEPRVATGLLRDELGFRGVLVSDNLEMGAVTARFGLGDAAVRALHAGCDALLLCHRADSFPRVRATLWSEARGSATLRARLHQAATRIRALKQAHATARAARPRPPLAVLGAAAHVELAARLGG